MTPSVLAERYAILRELGRGAMATVCLPRDLQRGEAVAVKILSPELAPILGAGRFARETRITSSIQHPGNFDITCQVARASVHANWPVGSYPLVYDTGGKQR